jgi:hypothetical protein
MGWYRRWNQKVYDESVLRKRPDGRYDFVYNGKFVWPYIVTAEQKHLIDRKLITPSGWAAVVVVLSIVATMVVVGYLRSPGFGSLLGFLLLMLVAAVLQLLIVWPLIWVRIFLRAAPRHPKPLYVRPPYPPKYDFSAMVTKAPELTLWAGMVICFGLDAVIASLSLRDLMRGTLGGDWGLGAGGMALLSTGGLICLLQWWGRPKDRVSAWTGDSIDLGIVKISRSKTPDSPRSDPGSDAR